jgi:hypothetical protein
MSVLGALPQSSGNLSQAYTNPLGVTLGPCTYVVFANASDAATTPSQRADYAPPEPRPQAELELLPVSWTPSLGVIWTAAAHVVTRRGQSGSDASTDKSRGSDDEDAHAGKERASCGSGSSWKRVPLLMVIHSVPDAYGNCYRQSGSRALRCGWRSSPFRLRRGERDR